MNDALELIALALVVAIAVPANVFVIGYALRRSPTTGKRAWRGSIFGKGLMVAEASLVALVDVELLSVVVPVPGETVVTLAVLVGLLIGQVLLVRALWQTRDGNSAAWIRRLKARLDRA